MKKPKKVKKKKPVDEKLRKKFFDPWLPIVE
jgi:hypothetical protein